MRTAFDDPSPPRQLIVCCDGTDNTLTAGTADTHVLRTYEHLKRDPKPNRVLFYDPGVGSPAGAPTTGPFDGLARIRERVGGLASGRGIYANIGDAYLFVVRNYRGASDQIYLFGFSRGAFTARCVAGMINLFGILDPAHEVMLPTLLRVYFSEPKKSRGERGHRVQRLRRQVHDAFADALVGREPLAEQIKRDFTSGPGRDAWVHWIGVWDTVESVGLPGPLSRSNPSSATVTDKNFHHVRHAISLDEHRWTFEPRLFEEPGDIDDASVPRTLKQRWFPGAHRDVGGGYSPEGAVLAEATLAWMLGEAIGCGLDVPALPARTVRATAHDELWDTPAWALAGMCLRDLRPTTAKGKVIAVIAGPRAGSPVESAWVRRRPVPPIAVALLLAAICLQRSGASLAGDGWHTLFAFDTWLPHVDQALGFATEQLLGPWQGGLGRLQQHSPAAVFWAMVWDVGFLSAWGYLLARIASRSFCWLAGLRSPGAGLPLWRGLGFAPLAAVGGSATANLSTVAAFLAHGIGVDAWAAWTLLALGSVASAVTCAGLVACLPLLAVRLWIAMPWVRRAARPGA